MAADTYEYPCPKCDNTFAVSTRQAGQDVTCPHCSAELVAPTLGALKKLVPIDQAPKEAPFNPNQAGKGNWYFVAGLFLLVIGVASGFGLQKYAEQQLIVDYNVEGAMDRMDPYVDELSQFEVALMFDRMQVDKGLGEWRELPHVASTKQGNMLLMISYGLYGIGGIGALLMLVGLLRR